MEEIKVGEHVRTKKGQIDIFKENDENYMFARCKKKTYWKLDIVKHIRNIIDLIEVGDIIEVYFPIRKITRKIFVDEYFKDSMVLKGLINGNIILKSILTHEQFEQNSYKV